jgi:hypothetical protein
VWGWLYIEKRPACWLMTATGKIHSAWVEGPERMPAAITEKVPYLNAAELLQAWEAMWRGNPPPTPRITLEQRQALIEWCEAVKYATELGNIGEKPTKTLILQLIQQFELIRP